MLGFQSMLVIITFSRTVSNLLRDLSRLYRIYRTKLKYTYFKSFSTASEKDFEDPWKDADGCCLSFSSSILAMASFKIDTTSFTFLAILFSSRGKKHVSKFWREDSCYRRPVYTVVDETKNTTMRRDDATKKTYRRNKQTTTPRRKHYDETRNLTRKQTDETNKRRRHEEKITTNRET